MFFFFLAWGMRLMRSFKSKPFWLLAPGYCKYAAFILPLAQQKVPIHRYYFSACLARLKSRYKRYNEPRQPHDTSISGDCRPGMAAMDMLRGKSRRFSFLWLLVLFLHLVTGLFVGRLYPLPPFPLPLCE